MKRHASMNRIYRLVWSHVLNAWIAVAETARGRGKASSRKLVAAALSLTTVHALASPSGGQVTAGSATITQSGTTTTITQTSQNASLRWDSFNTTAGETVNFVQPSASAIAVNRIYDTNGTKFFGNLNANGQVYLINPNGILFGAGSQVNVGGLVASTLDISDAALNSATRPFSGTGTGSIVNQGTINGRYVALLGNTVSNQGTITTPQGMTALGAGSAVTLTFADTRLVKMQVDQSTLNNLAENGGLIQAAGGMVLLTAGAKNALLASVVNNTGVIEARSVQNVNGTIVLDGGSLGTTSNSGTLDASGKNPGETGGTVKVLGQQVDLQAGTKIDVSGDAGGGTALIGGNFHGAGPEQNATTTNVATGASLNADAISNGNGGNIAIWSDQHTTVDGTFSARGGANGGNGGQIETSGKQLTIGSNTRVNTLAPMGTAGNWLLDPVDFTIYSYLDPATPSNILDTLLSANLNSTSVTIQTADSGGTTCIPGASCFYGMGGSGDITVTPNAVVSWSSATTLTLSAYRDVNVNGALDGTGLSTGGIGNGNGSIVLHADNTGTGTGAVNIADDFSSTTVYVATNSSALASTTIYTNVPLSTTGYTADGGGYVGNFKIYQLVRVDNTSATVSKSYDGTKTIASAPSFSLVGAPAGAGLTVGTASFADKNAGTNKAINYSGYSVSGSTVMSGIPATYWLAAQPNQTGTINKANATVTGNSSTGTYSGLAQNVSGFSASGLVNGETTAVLTSVSATGATGTNAGSYTNTVSGTDGNYNLSFVNGVLTINKANATVTGNSATGTYSGLAQSVSGFTASGLVNGETAAVLTGVSATGATGTNAGSYANTVSGSAGNYNLSFVNGALTINKANATVTGNSATGTYSGLAQSVGGFTASGLVNGETAAVLTGVSAAGATGTNAGSYANTVSGADGNYNLSFVNGVLTINKANATVTGNSSTGTYSGLAQSVGGFTASGLVNGETTAVLTGVSASGATGTNAGSYANTVSGSDGNYNLSFVNGALTINKANLTLGGSRAYDGTTTVAGSVLTAAGVHGETFSVTGAGDTSNLADKNVQTGSALISVTGLSLGSSSNGGLSSNYNALSTSGSSVTINKANLILGGSRTYDGTTTVAGSVLTASGANGETFSVTGAGDTSNLASKNVQTGSTLASLTGLGLGSSSNGGLSSNYNALSTSGSSITITPAALTLGGITASNKVYDGTTAATLNTAGVTFTGLLGTDVVTLGGAGTGAFADKNVGTGKTVTVSGYTLGGADGGNYTVGQPTGLTANITPAALSVSGLTASNKTYDATTAATVNTAGAVFAGKIAGDTVTVSATGTFADKNVGNGKTVTLASTYGGADAGNYTITSQASTTANITPAALSVSGITANNKTYDATTAATVSTAGAVLTGKFAGDTVTVSATGTFADKNVANGKTVTLSSIYGGADAGNYTITGQAGTTANITPATLTLGGITASNKVYDGTTAATLNTAGVTFTGLLGTDAVTLGGAGTGAFADKNVANGKTVTVSGYTLGGTDGGNYTVGQPSGLTANITPAALSVSGLTASNKTYDATTAATVNTAGAVFAGKIAGDTVTVSATGTFADKNVGNGKTVTLASTYGGADAGNYTFTGQAGTTANITAKAVTLTVPNVSKTYDGGLAYTVSNADKTALSGALVGGDTVTAAAIAYTDKNAGSGNKTVNLNSVTISDGNGGNNYSVTLAGNSTSTITPAALNVTANNVSKIYDGVAYRGDNGATYSGFAGADTAASVLSGTLVYGGSSQGATAIGNYAITPSGLTSNANYTLSYHDGTLTINALAPVTVPTPQPVQNAVAQVQSTVLTPQVNIQPPMPSLSPPITVSQSSTSGNDTTTNGGGMSSEGGHGTVVTNTTLNIGGMGATLNIMNGGMRLPSNMVTSN